MVLSLFFTRSISLESWILKGLFDREKLIYEEHLDQNNLDKVYWFTYGSNDNKLSMQLKKEGRLHENIEVFEMPKFFNIPKIGSLIYSIFLPFYYAKVLSQSDILKTNQMDGSWSAVTSKWLYKKKLLVRTGYTLSQLEFSKNKGSLRYKYYKLIERISYKYCDIAIVTSKNNKEYLLGNALLPERKINVVTNFIDVNLFKPLSLQRFKNKIIFVGRLNKEKNLFNLIEAISKTDLILDVYGQGDLKNQLQKFAKEKAANVNFMGVVSNNELVAVYNQYQYYILPSYFEGMPKTLLEAMACGCVCIGTNVNGINEVINDGTDGYLSDETNSYALEKIINKVVKLNNEKIIINGIKNIQDNFSLKIITKLEENIFNGMVNEK
jgi:glycosyltransferase involved in cell wall biosynthesis